MGRGPVGGPMRAKPTEGGRPRLCLILRGNVSQTGARRDEWRKRVLAARTRTEVFVWDLFDCFNMGWVLASLSSLFAAASGPGVGFALLSGLLVMVVGVGLGREGRRVFG